MIPKHTNSTKYISLLNIAFLGIFLLISVCGLARAVIFPKDINSYENRTAYQLTRPTVGSWLDKLFQEQTESALSDQIPGAQTMKKIYNNTNNILKYQTLQTIHHMDPNQKIIYSGNIIYHGKYITYYPNKKEQAYKAFDAKIKSLNHTVDTHPDTDFYLYYIEKDTDINFDTGEPLLGYEYLKERLHIPEANMAKFSINNLEEFETYFYQTDHHWNNKGSYLGYQQVLSLLDYGTALIPINGEMADDYGNQEAYLNNEKTDQVTYGSFYGGDDGEIIFETDQIDKKNILIIGESYDNAILKLLATHFNHTYSVDLRHYERIMGKKFHLDSYIKDHDIDCILLIGNVDYYKMEEFNLEDE